MTKEETDWVDPNSEPHATKVALAIGEELRTHNAIGFQWTLALIASALHDAKRGAYEEAARKQCPHCANGLPLTFAEDWRASNTFGEGNQVRGWLHEENGGYLTCQAGAIRALADSIGREGEE